MGNAPHLRMFPECLHKYLMKRIHVKFDSSLKLSQIISYETVGQ